MGLQATMFTFSTLTTTHRWKWYMRTKLLGTIELPDDMSPQMNIIPQYHEELCTAKSLKMVPQIPVCLQFGHPESSFPWSVITFFPWNRNALHCICNDVCSQCKYLYYLFCSTYALMSFDSTLGIKTFYRQRENFLLPVCMHWDVLTEDY